MYDLNLIGGISLILRVQKAQQYILEALNLNEEADHSLASAAADIERLNVLLNDMIDPLQTYSLQRMIDKL